MFNSTFFYGMVCSEPTWIKKGEYEELQFMVSTVDKEKEKYRDKDRNASIEYVQIPVIVTNLNFADMLMKNKGLAQYSKVTIEGTLTSVPGSFGSPIVVVAARTVRVERSDAPHTTPRPNRENFQDREEPPLNPARQVQLTGRLRNE